MEIDRTAWELRGLRRLEQWTGFLFGVLAWLALLVAAWGMDAWSLFRAGAMLPWAKLLAAGVCLLVPFSLLGWLSVRLKYSAIAAVLWLLAGVAFGWLATQLSFRFFPWALARWAPETAGFLAYRYGAGAATRVVVACVLSALIFFFAGLMLLNLIEGSSRAAYPVGRFLAILAWVSFFALSGSLVDALVNAPLRAPVTTLHNLISFRLSDPGAMDTEQALLLHASVFNPVEDLLPRSHRMVVTSFDKDVTLVRVLINFQGEWVQCTTIEAQPSYCEPLN
jgi:hypothetical protein